MTLSKDLIITARQLAHVASRRHRSIRKALKFLSISSLACRSSVIKLMTLRMLATSTEKFSAL